MVNASLAYEILLYINSFYFGLFATCELGTMILKTVILSKYEEKDLIMDFGVLLGLFIAETARLLLGRRGSLRERDIPVFLSVMITIPSILCVLYLMVMQKVRLRIEYIWCLLMLGLQVFEFGFASLFIVTMCKGPTYD